MALQMKGIEKSFAGISALRSVDFDVRAGEVHALLGANGAGKSTLMKILTGAYTSDGGQIVLDGQPVAIRDPQDAKRFGIQCVYQEVDTALVPYLSVAENILLEQYASGRETFIRWSRLFAEAEEILRTIGFVLPVRKKAEQLSLSEKQVVLIARAVVQQAKYIIFDEPTAPLSIQESERLFAFIERLKASGLGIIYISHRLPEIFRICDRVTILRDGRNVLTAPVNETSIDEVITQMLGKSFTEEFPKQTVPIGNVVLEAKGLHRGKKVRGVDISVREGEIVGVAGLVGAGKTELARLLFGADAKDAGEVWLDGKAVVIDSPQQAVQNGIVLVPEERRKEGMIADESVRHNLSLANLHRLTGWGFVKRWAEAHLAQELVETLGIKAANQQQPVRLLSGGNQQKVVVGKWLPTDARVFLFDEPTKGVDIGAKSDIFRLIGRLAQEKKGILYFSCEFQEILGIADRILVMCDGRIVKELTRAEATQEALMYYASGGE